MASRSFESMKKMLTSARSGTTVGDKMSVYDTWAENYDQDIAVLEYNASTLAAKIISSYFTGDCKSAVVLDVTCGTGLLATEMKPYGFGNFVGVDGSKAMMEEAKKRGLYQDLIHCILGEQPLSVPKNSFDVVVICGSLSVDHVPVCVVKELWSACKPGGYVFMTCRHGQGNLEYKATLERELKQMEEKGFWTCVEVSEIAKWARGVSELEDSYISGSVYLYQKL